MLYFVNKIFILSLVCFLGWSCSKEGASNSAASTSGKAGSLSKFTIVNNYLYAVDNSNLYSYDITNPTNPIKKGTTFLGFGVETIYPYNNKLFIGTTTGLFIYSIDTPSMPSKLAEARHARSCDPVVANDTIAFVTLKGNTACGPAESGLYVHNIKNVTQPILIKTLPIGSPEGLALEGATLYICCNNDGLKVYDVANPANPILKQTVTGVYFKDVIVYNNLLISYVSTGVALYDITNPINPILLKLIAN